MKLVKAFLIIVAVIFFATLAYQNQSVLMKDISFSLKLPFVAAYETIPMPLVLWMVFCIFGGGLFVLIIGLSDIIKHRKIAKQARQGGYSSSNSGAKSSTDEYYLSSGGAGDETRKS